MVTGTCQCPPKDDLIPTAELAKITKIKRQHEIYDCSNVQLGENVRFKKCINLYSILEGCLDIDPATKSGTISGAVAGFNIATIQYTVGGPATINFNAGIGKVSLAISVDTNTDGTHNINIHVLVKAPLFGWELVNKTVTIKLPF